MGYILFVTGYIPRSPFKFGNTYKEDCDFNIDQHLSNYKYHDHKMRDLQTHVRTAPQLHPIDRDPHVKNVLDKYRDTHPVRSILLGKWAMLSELKHFYKANTLMPGTLNLSKLSK